MSQPQKDCQALPTTSNTFPSRTRHPSDKLQRVLQHLTQQPNQQLEQLFETFLQYQHQNISQQDKADPLQQLDQFFFRPLPPPQSSPLPQQPQASTSSSNSSQLPFNASDSTPPADSIDSSQPTSLTDEKQTHHPASFSPSTLSPDAHSPPTSSSTSPLTTPLLPHPSTPISISQPASLTATTSLENSFANCFTNSLSDRFLPQSALQSPSYDATHYPLYEQSPLIRKLQYSQPHNAILPSDVVNYAKVMSFDPAIPSALIISHHNTLSTELSLFYFNLWLWQFCPSEIGKALYQLFLYGLPLTFRQRLIGEHPTISTLPSVVSLNVGVNKNTFDEIRAALRPSTSPQHDISATLATSDSISLTDYAQSYYSYMNTERHAFKCLLGHNLDSFQDSELIEFHRFALPFTQLGLHPVEELDEKQLLAMYIQFMYQNQIHTYGDLRNYLNEKTKGYDLNHILSLLEHYKQIAEPTTISLLRQNIATSFDQEIAHPDADADTEADVDVDADADAIPRTGQKGENLQDENEHTTNRPSIRRQDDDEDDDDDDDDDDENNDTSCDQNSSKDSSTLSFISPATRNAVRVSKKAQMQRLQLHQIHVPGLLFASNDFALTDSAIPLIHTHKPYIPLHQYLEFKANSRGDPKSKPKPKPSNSLQLSQTKGDSNGDTDNADDTIRNTLTDEINPTSTNPTNSTNPTEFTQNTHGIGSMHQLSQQLSQLSQKLAGSAAATGIPSFSTDSHPLLDSRFEPIHLNAYQYQHDMNPFMLYKLSTITPVSIIQFLSVFFHKTTNLPSADEFLHIISPYHRSSAMYWLVKKRAQTQPIEHVPALYKTLTSLYFRLASSCKFAIRDTLIIHRHAITALIHTLLLARPQEHYTSHLMTPLLDIFLNHCRILVPQILLPSIAIYSTFVCCFGSEFDPNTPLSTALFHLQHLFCLLESVLSQWNSNNLPLSRTNAQHQQNHPYNPNLQDTATSYQVSPDHSNYNTFQHFEAIRSTFIYLVSKSRYKLRLVEINLGKNDQVSDVMTSDLSYLQYVRRQCLYCYLSHDVEYTTPQSQFFSYICSLVQVDVQNTNVHNCELHSETNLQNGGVSTGNTLNALNGLTGLNGPNGPNGGNGLKCTNAGCDATSGKCACSTAANKEALNNSINGQIPGINCVQTSQTQYQASTGKKNNAMATKSGSSSPKSDKSDKSENSLDPGHSADLLSPLTIPTVPTDPSPQSSPRSQASSTSQTTAIFTSEQCASTFVDLIMGLSRDVLDKLPMSTSPDPATAEPQSPLQQQHPKAPSVHHEGQQVHDPFLMFMQFILRNIALSQLYPLTLKLGFFADIQDKFLLPAGYLQIPYLYSIILLLFNSSLYPLEDSTGTFNNLTPMNFARWQPVLKKQASIIQWEMEKEKEKEAELMAYGFFGPEYVELGKNLIKKTLDEELYDENGELREKTNTNDPETDPIDILSERDEASWTALAASWGKGQYYNFKEETDIKDDKFFLENSNQIDASPDKNEKSDKNEKDEKDEKDTQPRQKYRKNQVSHELPPYVVSKQELEKLYCGISMLSVTAATPVNAPVSTSASTSTSTSSSVSSSKSTPALISSPQTQLNPDNLPPQYGLPGQGQGSQHNETTIYNINLTSLTPESRVVSTVYPSCIIGPASPSAPVLSTIYPTTAAPDIRTTLSKMQQHAASGSTSTGTTSPSLFNSANGIGYGGIGTKAPRTDKPQMLRKSIVLHPYYPPEALHFNMVQQPQDGVNIWNSLSIGNFAEKQYSDLTVQLFDFIFGQRLYWMTYHSFSDIVTLLKQQGQNDPQWFLTSYKFFILQGLTLLNSIVMDIIYLPQFLAKHLLGHITEVITSIYKHFYIIEQIVSLPTRFNPLKLTPHLLPTSRRKQLQYYTPYGFNSEVIDPRLLEGRNDVEINRLKKDHAAFRDFHELYFGIDNDVKNIDSQPWISVLQRADTNSYLSQMNQGFKLLEKMPSGGQSDSTGNTFQTGQNKPQNGSGNPTGSESHAKSNFHTFKNDLSIQRIHQILTGPLSHLLLSTIICQSFLLTSDGQIAQQITQLYENYPLNIGPVCRFTLTPRGFRSTTSASTSPSDQEVHRYAIQYSLNDNASLKKIPTQIIPHIHTLLREFRPDGQGHPTLPDRYAYINTMHPELHPFILLYDHTKEPLSPEKARTFLNPLPFDQMDQSPSYERLYEAILRTYPSQLYPPFVSVNFIKPLTKTIKNSSLLPSLHDQPTISHTPASNRNTNNKNQNKKNTTTQQHSPAHPPLSTSSCVEQMDGKLVTQQPFISTPNFMVIAFSSALELSLLPLFKTTKLFSLLLEDRSPFSWGDFETDNYQLFFHKMKELESSLLPQLEPYHHVDEKFHFRLREIINHQNSLFGDPMNPHGEDVSNIDPTPPSNLDSAEFVYQFNPMCRDTFQKYLLPSYIDIMKTFSTHFEKYFLPVDLIYFIIQRLPHSINISPTLPDLPPISGHPQATPLTYKSIPLYVQQSIDMIVSLRSDAGIQHPFCPCCLQPICTDHLQSIYDFDRGFLIRWLITFFGNDPSVCINIQNIRSILHPHPILRYTLYIPTLQRYRFCLGFHQFFSSPMSLLIRQITQPFSSYYNPILRSKSLQYDHVHLLAKHYNTVRAISEPTIMPTLNLRPVIYIGNYAENPHPFDRSLAQHVFLTYILTSLTPDLFMYPPQSIPQHAKVTLNDFIDNQTRMYPLHEHFQNDFLLERQRYQRDFMKIHPGQPIPEPKLSPPIISQALETFSTCYKGTTHFFTFVTSQAIRDDPQLAMVIIYKRFLNALETAKKHCAASNSPVGYSDVLNAFFADKITDAIEAGAADECLWAYFEMFTIYYAFSMLFYIPSVAYYVITHGFWQPQYLEQITAWNKAIIAVINEDHKLTQSRASEKASKNQTKSQSQSHDPPSKEGHEGPFPTFESFLSLWVSVVHYVASCSIHREVFPDPSRPQSLNSSFYLLSPQPLQTIYTIHTRSIPKIGQFGHTTQTSSQKNTKNIKNGKNISNIFNATTHSKNSTSNSHSTGDYIDENGTHGNLSLLYVPTMANFAPSVLPALLLRRTQPQTQLSPTHTLILAMNRIMNLAIPPPDSKPSTTATATSAIKTALSASTVSTTPTSTTTTPAPETSSSSTTSTSHCLSTDNYRLFDDISTRNEVISILNKFPFLAQYTFATSSSNTWKNPLILYPISKTTLTNFFIGARLQDAEKFLNKFLSSPHAQILTSPSHRPHIFSIHAIHHLYTGDQSANTSSTLTNKSTPAAPTTTASAAALSIGSNTTPYVPIPSKKTLLMAAFVLGVSPRLLKTLLDLGANNLAICDENGFTAIRWGIERIIQGPQRCLELFGFPPQYCAQLTSFFDHTNLMYSSTTLPSPSFGPLSLTGTDLLSIHHPTCTATPALNHFTTASHSTKSFALIQSRFNFTTPLLTIMSIPSIHSTPISYTQKNSTQTTTTSELDPKTKKIKTNNGPVNSPNVSVCFDYRRDIDFTLFIAQLDVVNTFLKTSCISKITIPPPTTKKGSVIQAQKDADAKDHSIDLNKHIQKTNGAFCTTSGALSGVSNLMTNNIPTDFYSACINDELYIHATTAAYLLPHLATHLVLERILPNYSKDLNTNQYISKPMTAHFNTQLYKFIHIPQFHPLLSCTPINISQNASNTSTDLNKKKKMQGNGKEVAIVFPKVVSLPDRIPTQYRASPLVLSGYYTSPIWPNTTDTNSLLIRAIQTTITNTTHENELISIQSQNDIASDIAQIETVKRKLNHIQTNIKSTNTHFQNATHNVDKQKKVIEITTSGKVDITVELDTVLDEINQTKDIIVYNRGDAQGIQHAIQLHLGIIVQNQNDKTDKNDKNDKDKKGQSIQNNENKNKPTSTESFILSLKTKFYPSPAQIEAEIHDILQQRQTEENLLLAEEEQARKAVSKKFLILSPTSLFNYTVPQIISKLDTHDDPYDNDNDSIDSTRNFKDGLALALVDSKTTDLLSLSDSHAMNLPSLYTMLYEFNYEKSMQLYNLIDYQLPSHQAIQNTPIMDRKFLLSLVSNNDDQNTALQNQNNEGMPRSHQFEYFFQHYHVPSPYQQTPRIMLPQDVNYRFGSEQFHQLEEFFNSNRHLFRDFTSFLRSMAVSRCFVLFNILKRIALLENRMSTLLLTCQTLIAAINPVISSYQNFLTSLPIEFNPKITHKPAYGSDPINALQNNQYTTSPYQSLYSLPTSFGTLTTDLPSTDGSGTNMDPYSSYYGTTMFFDPNNPTNLFPPTQSGINQHQPLGDYRVATQYDSYLYNYGSTSTPTQSPNSLTYYDQFNNPMTSYDHYNGIPSSTPPTGMLGQFNPLTPPTTVSAQFSQHSNPPLLHPFQQHEEQSTAASVDPATVKCKTCYFYTRTHITTCCWTLAVCDQCVSNIHDHCPVCNAPQPILRKVRFHCDNETPNGTINLDNKIPANNNANIFSPSSIPALNDKVSVPNHIDTPNTPYINSMNGHVVNNIIHNNNNNNTNNDNNYNNNTSNTSNNNNTNNNANNNTNPNLNMDLYSNLMPPMNSMTSMPNISTQSMSLRPMDNIPIQSQTLSKHQANPPSSDHMMGMGVNNINNINNMNDMGNMGGLGSLINPVSNLGLNSTLNPYGQTQMFTLDPLNSNLSMNSIHSNMGMSNILPPSVLSQQSSAYNVDYQNDHNFGYQRQ